MDNEIQVSVYCLTYNHERYIRKTLEGFVNQKTNFRYKVVIHDDASTDKTQEILREYEAKYPDLFFMIYQTENQFSKGDGAFWRSIISRLEGKYVACCEGDDYWCDDNKLQKQFDVMEKNSDMMVCWHRVGLISESGTPLPGTYPAAKLGSGSLTQEAFIKYVCSDFFQLSSFFCNLEAFRAYGNNRPEYAQKTEVGDVPLTLYMGTLSKHVYFFDEIMSCYRVSSISSVMRSTWNNKERTRMHYKGIVDMIESFDACTNGRYHADCQNYKEMQSFECFALQKDVIAILRNPWCWRRFARLTLRAQASIAVKGLVGIIRDKVNQK